MQPSDRYGPSLDSHGGSSRPGSGCGTARELSHSVSSPFTGTRGSRVAEVPAAPPVPWAGLTAALTLPPFYTLTPGCSWPPLGCVFRGQPHSMWSLAPVTATLPPCPGAWEQTAGGLSEDISLSFPSHHSGPLPDGNQESLVGESIAGGRAPAGPGGEGLRFSAACLSEGLEKSSLAITKEKCCPTFSSLFPCYFPLTLGPRHVLLPGLSEGGAWRTKGGRPCLPLDGGSAGLTCQEVFIW